MFDIAQGETTQNFCSYLLKFNFTKYYLNLFAYIHKL